MGIALANIVPLCLAMACGFLLRWWPWRWLHTHVGQVINLSVYALMAFMGISIGLIDGIFTMLLNVGMMALAIASATSAGTALTVWLLIYWPLRRRHRHAEYEANDTACAPEAATVIEADTEAGVVRRVLRHLVVPGKMLGMVAIGFALAWSGWLPSVPYERVATALLYVMVAGIGLQQALSNVHWRELFANRRALKIVLCVLIGTYLGALAVAPLLPLAVKHTLGAASGMGWASLSGILFAQLGEPIVGSVAFLTDTFREAMALLLIPLLTSLNKERMAIGICAATCTDVTLPMVGRYATERRNVTAAFVSGSLLSFMVPFLIPLCI